MYRNSHLSKLILLGTLFLSMALALPLMAAAQDTTPPEPLAAESEPNDTIATADPITMGDTDAAIAPIGDVDYYRLSLAGGQRVYVAAIPDCDPNQLHTALAVYDAAGNLVAEPNDEGTPGQPGNYVLRFVAPATANYFVRVFSDGSYYEEKNGPYTLLARNVPADEPADFLEAVPLSWNSQIDSTLYAPYDLDRYVVHARAGDVFALSLTMDSPFLPRGVVIIRDANAIYAYPIVGLGFLGDPGTTGVTLIVPHEADWTVDVISEEGFCEPEVLGPQPYHLSIMRNSLYVAGSKAGNVDSVAFGANDVLARNAAGVWQMVFDGEDVGLTKPLGGVEFMDDGSLLLSLNAAQNLPGLGMVQPVDIVRFAPTQLGAITQGTFSFYLRGAQTGLTLQGERIDAIAFRQNGLLVSTYGSAVVPKFGGGVINARDEDLLLFHSTGPMPSAGTWELWLNGNSVYALGSKFGSNDLRGVTITSDNMGSDDDTVSGALFVADRAYRCRAWAYGGMQPFIALPGDPVFLRYWSRELIVEPIFWPPIQRTAALGFPSVISSLSIGPGWGD